MVPDVSDVWGNAPLQHQLTLSIAGVISNDPFVVFYCDKKGEKVATDPQEEQKHHRAEDIALFRYGIVREAADETLSKAKRGQLVRELCFYDTPRYRRSTGGRITAEYRPLDPYLQKRRL